MLSKNLQTRALSKLLLGPWFLTPSSPWSRVMCLIKMKIFAENIEAVIKVCQMLCVCLFFELLKASQLNFICHSRCGVSRLASSSSVHYA